MNKIIFFLLFIIPLITFIKTEETITTDAENPTEIIPEATDDDDEDSESPQETEKKPLTSTTNTTIIKVPKKEQSPVKI
jgi:hypothetical protein